MEALAVGVALVGGACDASRVVGTGGATGVGGDGGASGGAGASGQGPLVPGTGGATPICSFDSTDEPMPFVQTKDSGSITVACEGSATAVPLAVGNASGRTFTWVATAVPSNGFFFAEQSQGIACPGFAAELLSIGVRAPDTAVPGDTLDGTVRVTTNYGLLLVETPLRAVVVPTAFSVDKRALDFGSLPVGSALGIGIVIHNDGTAPLMPIHPTVAESAPFVFVDWGIHGEDAPPAPAVAPGESVVAHVVFTPAVAGKYDADWELTPFWTPPGAGCGQTARLTLHAVATDL
jgi:hypothetical protein